jgi:YHS domain-containing protein
MRRRTLLALAAILPTLALSMPALAEKAMIDTGAMEGIALSGYDAVSYFSGTPAKGSDEFSTDWKGAKWKFASAANRDTFTASPEKYAPQYGGYCAYAVSKGATAPGDPNAWTVVDNKLYLNFSPAVKETWSKDIPGNITKADGNWPNVLK